MSGPVARLIAPRRGACDPKPVLRADGYGRNCLNVEGWSDLEAGEAGLRNGPPRRFTTS